MRIAFVNHSRRKVGGVETYLDAIIPAFAAEHDIAFLYETDFPGRDLITYPQGASTWKASQLGRSQAIHRLKSWKPDICFVHGLQETELEADVVALDNAVLYVHNYYGSCISGNKMVVNGMAKPCERRFGPACLVHYFPDHCGGSNPLTMLRLYQTQSRRLELMQKYRALVTNSEHMTREMSRYGLASECVYPFLNRSDADTPSAAGFGVDPLQLIFSGRMTALKGGDLLVDALSEVRRNLNRRIHVTFAGDGPDRRSWQHRADLLSDDNLTFDFPGWLGAKELAERLRQSHLHVMPSVWPEPFGLSGLEAGRFGVPTVAFGVGGIPEWLHDGINGHLAAPPSTSSNLAGAIVHAFSSEDHYLRLRSAAFEASQNFRLGSHLEQLLSIFRRCAS